MSKCPSCGHPDAYVGLNDVECRKPLCKYWKPPTQEELKQAILSEPRITSGKYKEETLKCVIWDEASSEKIEWTFSF